jgi:hypothetical protein
MDVMAANYPRMGISHRDIAGSMMVLAMAATT